jgi:disulfide bond formation protein DsbB
VVAVLLAWPRARLVVGLLAALLVAGVGAYIAVAQLRHDYPPIFEWPTLFPRATSPAWLALLLVSAVALVDWVRSRPPWPARPEEGSQ